MAQELENEDELQRALPERVKVGLFEVSCKEIRRTLLGKSEVMRQLLLEVLQGEPLVYFYV